MVKSVVITKVKKLRTLIEAENGIRRKKTQHSIIARKGKE